MPVPFKVKAVYEYRSAEPDDLNFDNGQIITVTEEDDEDWYTGDYNDTSGQKRQGIFPRNFVEKYEPAIPSRPTRSVRPTPAENKTQEVVSSSPQSVMETRVDPPKEVKQTSSVEGPVTQATESKPLSQTQAQPVESKPTAAKSPPPVAEKPSGNSFRDRIAAFNKPAAAPVTPFKSGAGGTGFVKKAFVAPPPSRNSYVPPSTQIPAQKVYRREEDPSVPREDEEVPPNRDDLVRSGENVEEDQPKPTSLKDRIALLQQQQLEQAAKSAEKKKPKKPAAQRIDSADNVNEVAEGTQAPLTRQETGDTLGKKSIDRTYSDKPESVEDVEVPAQESLVSTEDSPPSRELVSDTNDADDSGAGDTEEAQEISTEEERHKPAQAMSPTQVAAAKVEKDDEAEDEEDTEDEDPEVRRRRELRERMAKMSGGMGMMGMFGGGMPGPAKKAKAPPRESEQSMESQTQEDTYRAPAVPIMALPGMAQIPRQPESESEEDDEEENTTRVSKESQRRNVAEDDDNVSQPTRTSTDRSIPQSPQERPAPPPPSREPRAVPPPPASAPSVPNIPRSPPSRALPPPPPRANTNDIPSSPISDISPQPPVRQPSLKMSAPPGVPPAIPVRSPTSDSSMQAPVTSTPEKRVSRAPPPPVPGTGPVSAQSRGAPPLPPGQPPSRRLTGGSQGFASPKDEDDDSEAEVTEYDGDYDTDIASSAKHKEALKSHHREISMDDEGTFTDDAAQQTSVPPSRAVPPIPPTAPPRNIPPPPPQSAPKSRPSVDVPRSLPPPIPMSRPDDDDYDPYNHSSPQHGLPTPPIRSPQSPPMGATTQKFEDNDMYGPPSQPPPRMPPPPSGPLPPVPTERMPPPPPIERSAPPPPPVERAAPPPPPSGPLPAIPTMMPPTTAPPRPSGEAGRQPSARRSQDVTRPSADYGFIASDLDLSETTGWWTYDHTPPPSIQGRSDILYEVESNTSTKRGGKTTITRDIYVLYSDHSQTTINVAFDAAEPAHATFQQSHQRPPPPPRQDQLESASGAFGSQFAKTASSISGKEVGDGSPQSFILELLKPFQSTALMPVGTRAYGALVYANLANASTQQFDEIRPGDIVTFRNAKFAGHKGGLHAKYSMDVGKPDHVGVVLDWDGTKKKIRALEQGREEKGKKTKVKEESFRVGDLKSGEVRVWRVMPRSWVGWDKS